PRHGGGWLRHWKASRKVKKILRKWKPDIVHAHNVTGYGYWGALSKFKPFFLTAWGSDLLVIAKENSMAFKMIRYSLKKADVVTADAQVLIESAHDIVEKRIDVRLLQWGVDLKEFDVPLSE